MSARIYRMRLARLLDGFIQFMSYVGPADQIPQGWSLVVRKALQS